jgi:acetolactate synthase-1/2/3 large subunit
LDAVDRHPKMRWVLTRHEQGAGLMALGYANASRGPALCMATVGPGALNMMAGVASAYKSHTPLIAITGIQDRWLHQRDGHKDLDQVAFYQPITKWSHMIPSGEKVPELLRRAFRIAMTGIPGPVHLGIPEDVVQEQIDFEPMRPSQYRGQPRMDFDQSQMDSIIELLAQARAPAILAGPELSEEQATSELVSAAEALGVPVATSVESDAIPYNHPLAVGSIGPAGSELARSIIRGADVLLALGTHFDFRGAQFRFAFISKDARVIQVCPFAQFLGSTFSVSIGVEGRFGPFLQALTRLAEAGRVPHRSGDFVSRKQQWDDKRRSVVDGCSKPISGQYVARVMRDIVPQDGIIVPDIGRFNAHIRRQFELVRPNTYFHPNEWGGIGVALPYAMGVKLARPRQEVIVASGDGGFMFHVGELETAVREKIKVTSVVFNDHGLSAERVHMKREYGGRYFVTEFGDVNFARIAEDMGGYGIRVTEPGDLPDALRLALKQERPAVIDVLTDPNEAE